MLIHPAVLGLLNYCRYRHHWFLFLQHFIFLIFFWLIAQKNFRDSVFECTRKKKQKETFFIAPDDESTVNSGVVPLKSISHQKSFNSREIIEQVIAYPEGFSDVTTRTVCTWQLIFLANQSVNSLCGCLCGLIRILIIHKPSCFYFFNVNHSLFLYFLSV